MASTLIHPVGDCDLDPESVISFFGMVPQANGNSPDFHRGLVTIAFFALDDIDVRSDLFLERAMISVTMKTWLEAAHDPNATPAKRAEAQRRIDRYKSAKSQHANCARSFERLFIGDRTAAEACFKAADDYRESKS